LGTKASFIEPMLLLRVESLPEGDGWEYELKLDLRTKVLSKLDEPIRYSVALEASLPRLIRSAREQGFEGLVAKQRKSLYEAGKRTGAWQKMRINRGQEFVIGGYTLAPKNFDALIFGYYEGHRLVYVARTRNGFTPALRDELFRSFRGLRIEKCPFANLPEARSGRWGVGLTAEKMKECRSPAAESQPHHGAPRLATPRHSAASRGTLQAFQRSPLRRKSAGHLGTLSQSTRPSASSVRG
jgi:ATP dependent DNA ligase C terminal region